MRALAAGFQMHVTKPVEPRELLRVIASLTGRLIQR
jgi:CheY-like chemotaxis protein